MVFVFIFGAEDGGWGRWWPAKRLLSRTAPSRTRRHTIKGRETWQGERRTFLQCFCSWSSIQPARRSVNSTGYNFLSAKTHDEQRWERVCSCSWLTLCLGLDLMGIDTGTPVYATTDRSGLFFSVKCILSQAFCNFVTLIHNSLNTVLYCAVYHFRWLAAVVLGRCCSLPWLRDDQGRSSRLGSTAPPQHEVGRPPSCVWHHHMHVCLSVGYSVYVNESPSTFYISTSSFPAMSLALVGVITR